MKKNATSILSILAIVICGIVVFSCDEKEDYDNFGPSVFQDNEPKAISGKVTRIDSVGQAMEYDTSYTYHVDTIVTIDTVLMDTTFTYDTTDIITDTTVVSRSVTVMDSSNVKEFMFTHADGSILFSPTYSETGFFLGATGVSGSGEGLTITIPLGLQPSDYNLTSNSIAQARYFTRDKTYTTVSGRLTLIQNDTATGALQGRFNFYTADSLYRVSNGSFNVIYQKSDL